MKKPEVDYTFSGNREQGYLKKVYSKFGLVYCLNIQAYFDLNIKSSSVLFTRDINSASVLE